MRSSQRDTADRSTSARRAISSVRSRSQSFQPRRWASSAAMAPPPQPYSRSMVMRRNMSTRSYRESVYRDSAAGPAFFHQEYQRNHRQDRDTEETEVIEIGQHGGLPQDCVFDQSVGLLGGVCRTRAVCSHSLRSTLKHGLERGVRGTEIVGQIIQMNLRAPIEPG